MSSCSTSRSDLTDETKDDAGGDDKMAKAESDVVRDLKTDLRYQ